MSNNRDAGGPRPWRLKEKCSDGTVREYSGTGLFDELVVEGVLHFEWLDGQSWYARIGDANITATVLEDGRVEVDVVRGANAAVCGQTGTWKP